MENLDPKATIDDLVEKHFAKPVTDEKLARVLFRNALVDAFYRGSDYGQTGMVAEIKAQAKTRSLWPF